MDYDMFSLLALALTFFLMATVCAPLIYLIARLYIWLYQRLRFMAKL